MNENSAKQLRRTALARTVISAGAINIEELAQLLRVSLVTAYRDVNDLADEGLLTLDRGMVTSRATSVFDMPSGLRSVMEQAEKESFAEPVASLVRRGASVIVDDSSSVLPALEKVCQKGPITVVTNSIAAIEKVGKMPSADIQCLGGRYSPWSRAFYGSRTIEAIADFNVDYCLMSDSAISASHLCNAYDYVAETKRAMIHCATTAILLADHTKFTRTALHHTAALTDFDVIVTDREPGEKLRTLCEDREIDLIVTMPEQKKPHK